MALVFEAFEAFVVGKNDRQEEDGDEEDEEILDREERLHFEEDEEQLDGLAGLAGAVVPGRAKLRQRLCWLGEQFKHRLPDQAHRQNLQAPELLQPQHFGIADKRTCLEFRYLAVMANC